MRATPWPSGLRRAVKVRIRKGAGSNPAGVILLHRPRETMIHCTEYHFGGWGDCAHAPAHAQSSHVALPMIIPFYSHIGLCTMCAYYTGSTCVHHIPQPPAPRQTGEDACYGDRRHTIMPPHPQRRCRRRHHGIHDSLIRLDTTATTFFLQITLMQ